MCCPLVFEFSVGIGVFVIGLGQISFFFFLHIYKYKLVGFLSKILASLMMNYFSKRPSGGCTAPYFVKII